MPKARTERARNVLTFGSYAEAWLRDRTLKPRTQQHYRSLLDRQLLPTFGHAALPTITPEGVRVWHATTDTAQPTLRAHAYGLLRTILASAVSDQLIAVNPCTIRGAGNSKRVHKIKPATLAELETLTAAMPQRYRAMVLLASWCGLGFGELAELRRKDLLGAGQTRARRPPRSMSPTCLRSAATGRQAPLALSCRVRTAALARFWCPSVPISPRSPLPSPGRRTVGRARALDAPAG